MTAKKKPVRPRIQITPSPELWRLIEVVHARTGTPKSQVVGELLDQIAPAFQTMIAALELATEAPRQAQQLMNNFASRALVELGQQQLDLDAAIDERTVKGKSVKRKKGPRSGPT